jgi:chorismate mutase/prephenate dehydratase
LQREMGGVELIELSSTTRAAERAAHEEASAAIAGRMAAEGYQLPILQQNVQDDPDNTTRFLVIGQESCPPTGKDRTSLMFGLRDEPGALFVALEPFYRFKLNLNKIESRPSRRKPWEYFFFVDVEHHQEDDPVCEVVSALKKSCSVVKVLGSYPSAGPDRS